MPSPHTHRRQKTSAGFFALALLIGLIGTLGAVALAQAQSSNEWRQTGGPQGGVISVIAVDPNGLDSLYLGTSGADVFKSADGGASWVSSDYGLPITSTIAAVVVSPDFTSTVYVGTDGAGVFASDDGGSSWQACETAA